MPCVAIPEMLFPRKKSTAKSLSVLQLVGRVPESSLMFMYRVYRTGLGRETQAGYTHHDSLMFILGRWGPCSLSG